MSGVTKEEFDALRELVNRNPIMGSRCGKCDNCQRLERVKQSVLRATNPPFSHADDGVVELWNTELKRLPCTARCQICSQPLEGMPCHHCIQKLTDDQLDEALVHVVTEKLTVAEILGYPAIYEELKGEFQNEMLDRAYRQMVEEHQRGEPDED